MLEKIKTILAKHLKVDPADITEDTNIQEDLGADSLDVVEIVMALENEFGIEIPDEDIIKLKTIRDAMNYIDARRKK